MAVGQDAQDLQAQLRAIRLSTASNPLRLSTRHHLPGRKYSVNP